MQNVRQEKTNAPAIIRAVPDLRAWRAAAGRVALVPTMGALHEGHLELVRQARQKAESVIVSIFVNPAQFGPNEDLAAYPRTWDADLEKLTAIGANAVFYPEVAEIYPPGFVTKIAVGGVSEPLEGERRPGHFDGVATIVAKLLLQAQPDVALFGEKDWQQLQVIKRLVVDLNIPVAIEGVPIVRDENGLALSSRNAYLTEAEYKIAVRLNKILFAIAGAIREGAAPQKARQDGMAELEQAGFNAIDYLEVRDAATLAEPGGGPLRVLAAVRCGKARLIDNVGV